ncbi:MAG TPA: hypothetical protein VG014_13465 [Acidimicrobiales bacterium]|nr:hypothetical protein [Acidimicrobiales bacterium]
MTSITESPPQVATRWSKLAPLLGLVFVVVVGASVSTANTPNTSNSPASILAYYQAHTGQVRASAFLVAPAVIFGLFWFAYLRNWLQRDDVNERWGAIAFAGGILFAVTGAVAGGVEFALVDTPAHLTASTATVLNFLEGDIPFILASMAFGVMAIAAGIAMIKSRALPSWLGVFSVVVGILGALPVGDFFALPAIGIWTLLVAGVMWFRTDPEGALAG